MPEHIHWLIREPQKKNPSTVMQALKLGLARRVLAQARRQRNPSQSVRVRAATHLAEAILRFQRVDGAQASGEAPLSAPQSGAPGKPGFGLLGWKPVQRGLVASPELWRWSGFRAYFLAEPDRYESTRGKS